MTGFEKIREEMMKNEADAAMQAIGNHLIGLINGNKEAEACVLAEDKTLKGAFEAIRKAAKAKAVNGEACLTDEEGFAIVRKYFGIEAKKAAVISFEDLM